MKWSVKINIHPLTLILIFVGCLTGYVKYLALIFLLVLVHELGHIFFALIFKRKVVSLTILPFGGLTKMDSLISANIFESLLISIGGIFFQTIFGFALILLKERGLIEGQIYEFLSFYNVILILFNLLPICPLDGYKMFKLLMELFLPFKKVFSLASLISFLLLLFFAITRFDIIKDNILVSVFLVVALLEEMSSRKYIVNRFYLERLHYDFDYPKKKIKKKEQMLKNRTHLIDGVDEKDYLKAFFT